MDDKSNVCVITTVKKTFKVSFLLDKVIQKYID